MNPERWKQVKDVLAAALELDPDERPGFLDRSCAGDGVLRTEVEWMLLHEKDVSPHFLGPAALSETAAIVFPEEVNPWIGRQIGSYRIVELIGGGGMGEVYRAFRDDDQFRKKVALKVVRAGHESRLVIARFKNERQILANLEHPNIARLLDGGSTEDGVPYFVMELIEGLPITEYCDRHRLTIPERLRLFRSVCAAVRYAHQHLIIHRDIKPGNILVTEEGTPKLLDFGISKILEFDASGSSSETTTAFRALTPRYASPEQIKGAPMTTASDIYSLGVVLHELLSGCSPYLVDTGSSEELAEGVCKDEAVRPSQSARSIRPGGGEGVTAERIGDSRRCSAERLHKLLNGDLDNIVLMALRKEPSRRYASVDQFEEDITRHLANVPVVARKDTSWYRMSKFVRRHRAGVAASAVVILALTIGVTISLHEARVARQQAQIATLQRARAERRFNDVRKLANSLMFEVHDSIRDLPGATAARKLVIDRAREYLDSLSQEAGGDASLQRELAAAYDRVGDLLGYNGAANLGDYAGATKSYNKALAIRESAIAANPGNLQMQSDLLNEYFRLSFVMNDAGHPADALRNLDKALPLAQSISSAHSEARYRDWLAGVYWQRGNIQLRTGGFEQALSSCQQGAAIRETIASGVNANPMFRTHLAADYVCTAKSLTATGDLNRGLAVSAKSVALLEQLVSSDPRNATLQEYLGEALSTHAAILAKRLNFDDSLMYQRKARDVFAALLKSDPTDSLALDNVALSDIDAASVFVRQGKSAAAIPLIQRSNAVLEKIEDKNQSQIEALAGSYGMLGTAYTFLAAKNRSYTRRIADLQEAKSDYQKSLNLWTQGKSEGLFSPLSGGYTEEFVSKQLAQCETQLARVSTTGASRGNE